MDPAYFQNYLLLKYRKIDLNSISFKDANLYLKIAVHVGDVDFASKLLSNQKADVNFRDEYSILHAAVSFKDIAMVRLLVSYKVNPNRCPDNRETISPLWIATISKCDDIAELLIRAGANVNERIEPYDVTPLHVAAASESRRRVNLLIDYGADINSKNSNGKSVLQYALLDGRPEIVELLLKRGADINAADDNGMSALHQAASNGDKSIVLLLLRYGADVRMVDNQGSNALHYASGAQTNNKEVTEILLKHGTPVNCTTVNNHLTPLHYAIFAEKNEMANLLIQYGADLQAKSKVNGNFPLVLSVQSDNTYLAKLLLDNGALINDRTHHNKTALHQACIRGVGTMVQLLMDYGADVDALNQRGRTPLMNVSLNDDHNISIATMLIKKIAMLGDRTNKVNLEFINNDTRLRKIYDEFREEIENMKRVKLGANLNFSYHFVFAEKHEKIVNLARNEEVVESFQSRKYFEHFPLYAQEMEEKFEKAKQVTERVVEKESMLCETLGKHLPWTAIQNVVRHLDCEN